MDSNMSGKSTTDAMSALRLLMERKQKSPEVVSRWIWLFNSYDKSGLVKGSQEWLKGCHGGAGYV